MTTTFCDLLVELTRVIRTSNIELVNKMSELENTVKELSVELKDIKANSDYTRNKLHQVETAMEGMNLPAYSSAIIELAQKVDDALGSVKCIENPGSTITQTG